MKACRFHIKLLLALVIALTIFSSCKKTENKIYPNNEPVNPHRVPTIKVENYVNRLFIDLIGRSALEEELARETDSLKAHGLSLESRMTLIDKLQNDTSEVVGDSSYNIAYNQRLYDIMKSRMCEGAPDSEFQRYINMSEFALRVARLEGDSVKVYDALFGVLRNKRVIDGKYKLRNGEISINQMFARLMDNQVYDFINMNTFNFVNATFDNLFYRFPTQEEFDIAYEIVANNTPGPILGGVASTKAEYCKVLTESDEFYEGFIRWTYQTYLGRDATSQEVVNHFSKFALSSDYKQLQMDILITDEYADF